MPMRNAVVQEKDRAARELLQKALAMHGGNRTYTARYLKVDRNYLLRLIKKYGLK